MARTTLFQGVNPGSIPGGGAEIFLVVLFGYNIFILMKRAVV